MAWIESHTVLSRHRKVLFLAHDLHIPIVQAIGHLHAFWHTVLEQQEDGDLSEWPDDMIEKAALWEGEPGSLVSRLRERGWIDGHLVHDWLDYTGKFLISKYSSGNVDRLKHIWMKHGYKYGKGQGKYAKQKASSKRQVSDKQATIPNQPLPLKKESPPPPFAGGAVTVEQVVQTWNAIPGVRQCAEKPAGFIADRIRKQIVQHPDWDWWASYWHLIAESDFLCGRSNDFAASIDWVLGPKNMAKVQNGNYRNKSPVARLNTTCQTRVQCGLQLKPCGQPAIGLLGKRPVCQAHQEEHVKRTDNAAMRSGNGTSGSGSVTLGSLVRLDKRCVAG